MTQVPTPPASRQSSEAPAVPKPAEAPSELLQSLDVLLEQYLHLLDRQQKLQSGLGKQLSSGFLALAHANYTCPPGRRYGADYYDERMKATRKISIRTGKDEDVNEGKEETGNTTNSQPQPPPITYNFALEQTLENAPKPESQEMAEKDEKTSSTTEHLQPEAPPPQKNGEDSKEPDSDEDSTESKSSTKPDVPKKKFHSDDPIHWYGILVPASLRNAQRSFTEGVQSQVPELAGVILEMRATEQKITNLRAELGVRPLEEASSS